MRAILSNGGYFQVENGIEVRTQEIRQINEQYEDWIAEIMDPGKAEREQREIEESPMLMAGISGLDRLRWDFMGAQQVRAQVHQIEEAAAA